MEELQGPLLSCDTCDYVTQRPDLLSKHRYVMVKSYKARTFSMTLYVLHSISQGYSFLGLLLKNTALHKVDKIQIFILVSDISLTYSVFFIDVCLYVYLSIFSFSICKSFAFWQVFFIHVL